MSDTITNDIIDRLKSIFTDVLGYASAQEVTDPETVNLPFVSIWAQDASHLRSEMGEKIVQSTRTFYIRGHIKTLSGAQDEVAEREANTACTDALNALYPRATLWVSDLTSELARIDDSHPVADSGFLAVDVGGKLFAGFVITLEVVYLTQAGYGF